METGIVTESTGSRYIILTPDGRRLETRLRGRLRLNGSRTTNPVAVGDRVLYEETPEGATITAVEPRRNYLIRRASNLSKESHVIASNLDRALLVATLFSPVTNTEFIDRFLVTCEAYAIPAAIVLNKLDLAAERPDELDEFIAIYETAGYTVYPVSATEGTGLETLRELTAGKTTLLTGNSGRANPPSSRRSYPMQMSASTGFRSTTTRGCTRPRSPACTRWQAAETSSTPPASRDSGSWTSNRAKCSVTFRNSCVTPLTANTTTARIRTNPAVQSPLP